MVRSRTLIGECGASFVANYGGPNDPHLSLITQAWLEHAFGASRARICLGRVHYVGWRPRRFSAFSATSARNT
jgi:hypothetical protein